MPRISQKPQYPNVDWNNPLSKGLMFAWVPNSGPATAPVRELLGLRPTFTGIAATDVRYGQFGYGIVFDNVADRITFGNPAYAAFPNMRLTIVAVVRADTVSATRLIFGWVPTVSNAGFSLAVDASSKLSVWGNNAFRVASGTTLVNGTEYVLGVTWDAVTLTTYLNGRLDKTGAWATAPDTSGGSQLTAGTQAGDAAPTFTYYGLFAWNRPLSARDMATIAADPWDLVTPKDTVDQSNLVGAMIAGPLAPPVVSAGGPRVPHFPPHYPNVPFPTRSWSPR